MNKIAREQADLYQDFFNFLSQEHNLTCTIEEMDEIIHEAQTFVKNFDIADVSNLRELFKCDCGCTNHYKNEIHDSIICADCGTIYCSI